MDDFFFQAVPDGVGELQQEQREQSHTLLTHLKVRHSTQSFLNTDNKLHHITKIRTD